MISPGFWYKLSAYSYTMGQMGSHKITLNVVNNMFNWNQLGRKDVNLKQN